MSKFYGNELLVSIIHYGDYCIYYALLISYPNSLQCLEESNH